MDYVRVSIAIIAVVAVFLSLGAAERKALLPAGIGIEAGDYVIKDKLSLIVYGRGEPRTGSQVVLCTGFQCFLGNVTGERHGVLLVSGDPATLPAPVNPRSKGLYTVKMVVPVGAWMPLLLLAATASAYYAYHRAGAGMALLLFWIILTAPLYSLLMPEIYTGVPKPPRAELVSAEVTENYTAIVLNLDLKGRSLAGLHDCTITAGNRTFPTIASVRDGKVYVMVPSDAWEAASKYYRSPVVFINVDCASRLEGLEDTMIHVSVPIKVRLPEPRVELEDARVVIENPSPVRVRLVATLYYVKPTEKLTINETIPPGGRLVFALNGHERMTLEGVIVAPWGAKPVGAVLP